MDTKSEMAEAIIQQMESEVIDILSQNEEGYGARKKYISEQTGIPIDILTVILKRLKLAGKVEHIVIWSEDCVPAGSGYCIAGNLN